MVDGSLSQEEIDLLLQGADDFSGAGSDAGPAVAASALGQDMSPLERETVADLIQHAMSAGTQGLGMILARNARVGAPYAEVKDQSAIERDLKNQYTVFAQNLSGGLNGPVALFIPQADAARLAAVVMGNEATVAANQPLDSAQIAVVKESVGPMLFTMASQLSAKVGQAITPMPVEVRSAAEEPFALRGYPTYLKIQLPFSVENAFESRVQMVLPLALAIDIYNRSRNQGAGGMGGGMGGGIQVPSGPMPGQSGIKDVGFPPLSQQGPGPLQPNMNLLMDVKMTLTVELGRTPMYIKDILALGEGSIIELEKLAGEPVDLLVNSKLIAKGEVVVIDENFGVRVTDIVTPFDRLKKGAQNP
ncbi:MAG: flagellar motor switch protein FliN [Leptospirales bacterium]|nr:flagellar motor switch protein FliN [Leptospirales bacterium]